METADHPLVLSKFLTSESKTLLESASVKFIEGMEICNQPRMNLEMMGIQSTEMAEINTEQLKHPILVLLLKDLSQFALRYEEMALSSHLKSVTTAMRPIMKDVKTTALVPSQAGAAVAEPLQFLTSEHLFVEMASELPATKIEMTVT